MELDTTLSLFAALLGFYGSMYLALGILCLTPEIIAEQALTKWNYNRHQLDNIANQKANFHSGIALVAIAFFSQIINLTFAHSSSASETILSPYWKGALSVLFVSIVVLIIVRTIRVSLVEKYKFSSLKYIAKLYLVRRLENNEMGNQIYYEEIVRTSKDLLSFEKKLEETPMSFLKRYGDFLGVEIPTNIDLSKIKSGLPH